MGSIGSSSNEYVLVGLNGQESDEFMEKYHNKQLIGSKTMNTMNREQALSINSPLRKGEMPTDEKAIKLMNRLEKGIQRNELPQDMTLFRGMSSNSFSQMIGGSQEFKNAKSPQDLLKAAQKLIGKTIEEKGYLMTSASSERNIFIFNDIGMHIQAPKGLNAYISNYKDESEIILPRGMQLKVVGAKLGKMKAKNGNTATTVQLITRIVNEDKRKKK